MAYQNTLADPFGMATTGIVVMWCMMALLCMLAIGFLTKALDPRPIVEISSDGMIIRTFLFLEDFVPWHEIAGIRQEYYTNRVIGTQGFAQITGNLLRIYRPNQRSLAINLTLLNKRGNEFSETISRYLAS